MHEALGRLHVQVIGGLVQILNLWLEYATALYQSGDRLPFAFDRRLTQQSFDLFRLLFAGSHLLLDPLDPSLEGL